MIGEMGALRGLGWSLVILGMACVPSRPRVVVDDVIAVTSTQAATPWELISTAGVAVQPGDKVLADGREIDGDKVLDGTRAVTLQVQHARHFTINGKAYTAAAWTIGEAVGQSGYLVDSADRLDPPAGAPLQEGVAITLHSSEGLVADGDGVELHFRSAATSLEQGLADAGLPLEALDIAASEGAQVNTSHLIETLDLQQNIVPFPKQVVDSADLPLGQEVLQQAGLPGLTVIRTRTQYLGEREVARFKEPEVAIRDPIPRVVARGTAIQEDSTTVAGTAIQYWHVMQMYATVYSPCNSGSGGCSYGTASGLRAGKGVVAVDPTLYAQLNGQRLFIPGYGFAVIGDIGGGYIVEQKLGISRYKWIDLGFDDNNIQDMTGWITVYFLAPAPATVPEVLK